MSNEIAVQQSAEISPMQLIQQAVQSGAAIETVERLVVLQRDMREYEAKVAFDGAMHRVQAKMKRIGADALNPQTKSKYATYAALDKVLRPLYGDEGFSLSFNNADCPTPDYARIICYVSREGHTRTYQIDMPADGKGAKGGDVMTKTHATGAAQSYGMRYLLKMIFNVAVGEEDRDGNASSGNVMDARELDEILDNIANAHTQEELGRIYKAAYKSSYDMGDQAAVKAIVTAKDRRKADL